MKKRRSGFTLIELVVVVLILGILAAMAAPKLLDITGDARENATRQSLSVIRDALELHKMEQDAYPATASIPTSLTSYIHGTFPAPEVGPNKGDATVREYSGAFSVSGTQGWAFDPTTGDFRVNAAAPYDAW